MLRRHINCRIIIIIIIKRDFKCSSEVSGTSSGTSSRVAITQLTLHTTLITDHTSSEHGYDCW